LPLTASEEKLQVEEHATSHPRGIGPIARTTMLGMDGKRPQKSTVRTYGRRKARGEPDQAG
jgi:hypothetical protein